MFQNFKLILRQYNFFWGGMGSVDVAADTFHIIDIIDDQLIPLVEKQHSENWTIFEIRCYMIDNV